MLEYRRLDPGDPAPWFRQRSLGNQSYVFDTSAGRYVVLCFFVSGADAGGRAMLDIIERERALFDDANFCVFGVSADPTDLEKSRIREMIPGVRYFLDFDRRICSLYGAMPVKAEGPRAPARRMWMVLDPSLTVRAVIPARPMGAERGDLVEFLQSLPPVATYTGGEVHAPVISLDGVLEPDLCQTLIRYYEEKGGEESGFMREVDGKTVMAHDFGHKRRSDCTIEDEALHTLLQQKVMRRVVPAIKKVHQFDVTRMERYIVGCYEASTAGHFRPHRDNTTKGTAHRRFAMSINLNADFEGGLLSFPEYGPRQFKPKPGGAVVFSCSLLHTVSPVTAGRRFAFLPFLYDEAAAALREQNNAFLDEGIGAYRR